MIPNLELSTQAATLISALLGGVVGSVGTYYGQNHLRRKRQSERTDWVRHALLSELESMEALEHWPLDPPDGAIPGGDWLHNQVFEALSGELGRLESDELHALISFHGLAEHARSDIQELTSTYDDLPDAGVQAIQNNLASVKRHQKAAAHLLSSNLNN